MRSVYSRREILKLLGIGGVLGSTGLLGACGGSNPDEVISDNLLVTTPENQAATFRNVSRLFPTRTFKRGTSVRALGKHSTSLDSLTYQTDGKTLSVDDFMQRNRTAGLLILKNGAIALERYAMGNNETSLWTSFSAAKSLTSTLVGAALKDGLISSLDDPVTRYVGALKGSAYEQNTIVELMRMTSGVRWTELSGITPDSDILKLINAIGYGKKGQLLELMRTRPRAAAPGTVWNYSTGETYVLGLIVSGATGMSLSEYLSKKIWAPYGMEADGYWALDSEQGQEFAGGNFSATLRDYGRFGLFFMGNGVINGTSVLPDGWRSLAGLPSSPVTNYTGLRYPGDPVGYGFQWWSMPTGAAAFPYQDGAFSAEGSFGQFIHINPKEDIVAVVWSAWRDQWSSASEFETYALLSSAAKMLR